MNKIKEFHLFAGMGGGIYGGELLGHACCGGVEIDEYCQALLKQRQKDGWMNEFEIYGDLTKLSGKPFEKKFDVLCGGFPCQAFSHAAHGKNIAAKNLWGEMFRFVKESEAPIVFGENVTHKAISHAKADLELLGYTVKMCKLSCEELGADHRRHRYWLLAIKDQKTFKKLADHITSLPKLSSVCWSASPSEIGTPVAVSNRRAQLKAIGNAQSPIVAATAFRILVNRHLTNSSAGVNASLKEIEEVFDIQKSWIKTKYGEDFGLVHTPTTMANYSAKSMMKHQGCRNFVTVFAKPTPDNAEYLMGMPLGASSLTPANPVNFEIWNKVK